MKRSAAFFVAVASVSFQAVSLLDIGNAQGQQASEIKRTRCFNKSQRLPDTKRS